MEELHSPQNRGQYSAENSAQYFIESQYADLSGKSNKEYLLTRDGFSLLVMGFTGKRALEWKLKYIEAFNKVEEKLKVHTELNWNTKRVIEVFARMSDRKQNFALQYAFALEDDKAPEIPMTEEGAELMRIFKSASVRQRFDLLDSAFSIDDKNQALLN